MMNHEEGATIFRVLDDGVDTLTEEVRGFLIFRDIAAEVGLERVDDDEVVALFHLTDAEGRNEVVA